MDSISNKLRYLKDSVRNIDELVDQLNKCKDEKV
jgi:hypothetical protein